jgi:hypothetical protein
MSEDIDLKIVTKSKPSRRELGNLRSTVTDALLAAGFRFDPRNPQHRQSMYKNSFTRYQLPCAPIVEGKGVLRPEIKIETSVWPMRRPWTERTVPSFIAEGFGRPAEVASIACTAILESAAEKLVALTRRASAQLAGLRQERDPTLMRHVYDLHAIREQYDPADVASLAQEIMLDDAKAQGRDFPAYQANPLGETLKSIEGIATSEDFAKEYAAFSHDMVYGDAPNFQTAIATLRTLAEHLEQDHA